MCGYAGFIWKEANKKRDIGNVLSMMGEEIRHRGPDSEGVSEGPGFSVIHRRLSIIDIAHGQQPMLTEDDKLGIAYNGEIYNHAAIRIELEARGITFDTKSDTEVFLHAFAVWGTNAFDKLDGMFTAFIWDFRSSGDGEFYLVRDHLGVKPLYIYEDDDKYIFSSEIKVILSCDNLDLEPDERGLASYLTYRYCHSPYTFFKNITRIEAGTYLHVRNGRSTSWRYWDLPQEKIDLDICYEEAMYELKNKLRKSVSRQLISEVPVGLLLSGGLDSSALAALCVEAGARLTSFNIGFPNLNEFEFSDAVAKKFNLPHVKIETTPEELSGEFETVIRAMDEAIADPACFPLYTLCGHIKNQVTVVLSGEGSDEMLGGYTQYQRFLDDAPLPGNELFDRFLEYSWYFPNKKLPLRKEVAQDRLWLHRKYLHERSLLNGALAYDLKTWLPENLMAKADKILMSHSLEGRFPFLTKNLVEFVSGLPEDFKIGRSGGKSILKDAFTSDLPNEIIGRQKMGFSVPVDEFVLQLKDRFYQLFYELRGSQWADYLDLECLKEEMDKHYSGDDVQPLRLWTILVLFEWLSFTI